MTRDLDITPLRSLIAVADTGGFHRAAADLQLSQSAVSQHIRRLDRVVGAPVVEPDGRRTRLTPVGVALLAEARKIIAVHDEALRRLAITREAPEAEFVIGTTDHAADHILPPIVEALARSVPGLQVKFRFDRTSPLNDAIDKGSADLVVFIAEASCREGIPVGALALVWCAAPSWKPPPGEPWPLIAIEAPCAIRGKALAVLGEHGIHSKVVAEAAYLAGVLNAARAGLGVTLLALAGPPPEGLVEFDGLPAAPPISLTARARVGADMLAVQTAIGAVHSALVAVGTLSPHRFAGHRSDRPSAAGLHQLPSPPGLHQLPVRFVSNVDTDHTVNAMGVERDGDGASCLARPWLATRRR
jgi:DNA-binding transcriptional LysR family regulator